MATQPNPNGPSRPPSPEREAESTFSLLRRLIDDVATLFRQEMALARAEFSRSLSSAKAGVASVATGGAVLFAGLLVLLSAAVLALALVLPAWLAALIVGLVVGAVGYLMLSAGRRKLEPSALKPVQTQESLRRDKEVLDRARGNTPRAQHEIDDLDQRNGRGS